MSCDAFTDRLPAYVRGALAQGEAEELESHIESCAECRQELEDLKWFFLGAGRDGELVTDGHIASRLMYDYADDKRNLSKGALSYIDRHLETCEGCRLELSQTSALIAQELEVERAGTRERAGGWFSWNRLGLVGAAVAVLVIAGAYLVSQRTPAPADMVAVYAASDTPVGEYPMLDLPLRPVSRAPDPEHEIVSLINVEGTTIGLRLRINVFEDEEPPAWVAITPHDGKEVWRGAIGTLLADTSTVILVINRSMLTSDTYKVDILDRHNTVVVRGRIEI